MSVFCFRKLPVLVALVAAGGCAPRDADRAAGIVDDAGRTVSLVTPARRIVSLAPSTTDLLFAIGAGDRLVGRTRWAAYPSAALEIPSVGDGLDPNIEVIVARRPDLVVFYASEANAPAVERLERLGVPTVSVRMDALQSVPRAARLLGLLTGTAPRADSLASAFEARLDSVRAATRHRGGPAVAILGWDNPPIVIGRGSFLTELIRLAGARNVFDDIQQASATVSIEAIAERDPDLFVLIGVEGSPGFAGRPEWNTIPAVHEGRFALLDGSEFSWPSFRAFDGVARLRVQIEGARP